jgi:Domain of unknown function (DUF202)
VTEASRADRGLAPERTELAWRRTLIAFGAAALVSLRVLPPVLGPWALGAGIGGLLLAVVLWVLSARRNARSIAPVGGGLLLVLAAGLLAGALVAVAAFVVRATT